MKVVDASAVAAVLFGEENAQELVERLANERLLSPDLLSYELANICVVKCRRDPTQRRVFVAALANRTGLRIHEEPVDHDAVAQLALETGLSAYDASYLWLAQEFDAELVTLDKALDKAWSSYLTANRPTPPPA